MVRATNPGKLWLTCRVNTPTWSATGKGLGGMRRIRKCAIAVEAESKAIYHAGLLITPDLSPFFTVTSTCLIKCRCPALERHHLLCLASREWCGLNVWKTFSSSCQYSSTVMRLMHYLSNVQRYFADALMGYLNSAPSADFRSSPLAKCRPWWQFQPIERALTRAVS